MREQVQPSFGIIRHPKFYGDIVFTKQVYHRIYHHFALRIFVIYQKNRIVFSLVCIVLEDFAIVIFIM